MKGSFDLNRFSIEFELKIIISGEERKMYS